MLGSGILMKDRMEAVPLGLCGGWTCGIPGAEAL